MSPGTPRQDERASVPMKDGSVRGDVRADRLQEHDARNADYPVRTMLPDGTRRRRYRSYTWRVSEVLDQDWNGACVGFAWAHELIARPLEIRDVDATFAREDIYYEAQRRDRWPGGEYPGASPLMAGTSVLAAAKVVAEQGYIEEYRWAEDVWELASALGALGPAVIGCALYERMREPDERGFISPDGTRLGGHAFLAMSVRIRPVGADRPDPDRSSFVLQNSWGDGWGDGGRARITFSDLERLWDGIEVCIPVSRSTLGGPGR